MGTLQPGPAGRAPDTSRHRALAAVSRVRMLHMLRRSQDGMTADEVATATGLHPSTVRAHLDKLTESGLLTRQRASDGSPGRPAWRYEAASQADTDTSSADQPYRDLAAALIGYLARDEDDPHAAGIRAGRSWGRALAAPLGRVAPVDGLVHILDGLGFSPQVVDPDGPDATVVHLRSCPFLELAEASPDVVCGVHLGVIGGAMGAMGASGAGAELEPFAAPGACVVRIHARGGAPAGATPPKEIGDARPADQ